MFILATIVTGAAIALAFYHLEYGASGQPPRFGPEFIAKFGVVFSVVGFSLMGPVLVLREIYDEPFCADEAQSTRVAGHIASQVVGLALFAIWSGALGVVAFFIGQMALGDLV